MNRQKQKIVDFVVIGSGIAGLNTALNLSQFGKVLIITKGKLSASSTFFAQGGIAAVFFEDDSINSHIGDTLAAGYYHNKKQAVEILAKGGSKAVEKLITLGVPFDKSIEGKYLSSYEAAHSYPRVLHATDFTGKEIEKTLSKNVLKNKNIEVWENTVAINLITKNNKCFGVKALKQKNIINIFSKTTVMATGGVGQLYKWTTNPVVATGDGIAIAQRAGAKLSDLEFMQIHPTAFKEVASPLLLLSEALRGEGAILLNNKKEKFMNKYHKLADLAPRDVVARAIFAEQKNGEVYLNMRHKPKEFLVKRFPNIYKKLKIRGFDLALDLVPVTPAAHFMCGGIKTDIYGRTSIKNLFAYGEVAATGVHGANRLASNSLLEGMVFSEQIKKIISEFPKNAVIVKDNNNVRYTSKRINFLKEKNEIKETMWNYVGLVRNPKGLETALSKLINLQTHLEKIKNINEDILEIKNMLETAILITQFAKKRKKSLGAHFIK